MPAAVASIGPQMPENQWVEWTAEDGPVHFEAGTLGIDLSAVLKGDLHATKVTLTESGSAKTDWTGDGTSWSSAAKIALVRLTPDDVRPRVLLSSFSGGAHCCASLTMLTLDQGRWQLTEFGAWDGDTPTLPTDLNADGVKEFTSVDQAFLYAFASYAESWAPPVIQVVEGQEIRDVSGQLRFRPVFATAADRAKASCLETSNGACAAYVAAAARAGTLDEAWTVMLRSYDQASDWTLPTACRLRTAGECPSEAKLTFGTFPEALQWFLGEHGYTSQTYVEPLRTSGPSFDCGGVTTNGELQVCANSALSTLDRTLAVAFTRATALSRDRGSLRAAQRAFLFDRYLTQDVEQLTALYQARIDQLLSIE